MSVFSWRFEIIITIFVLKYVFILDNIIITLYKYRNAHVKSTNNDDGVYHINR